MATIKQPEWCNYPDAAVPFWGCWSLLAGIVANFEYIINSVKEDLQL